MKTNRLGVISLFVLFDIAVYFGIFRLSVFLRNILTPFFGGPLLTLDIESLMNLGILFGVIIFFINNIYPGYGLSAVKELEQMSKSVTLLFFLLAAISFLNKPFQDISRSFLLISWVLALMILPLSHFVLRNIISRFSWYGTPVVIFGDDKWGQDIKDSLIRVRRLGWNPKLILPSSAILNGAKEADPNDIAILVLSPGLSIEKFAHKLINNFRKVILVRQVDGLGSVWVEPRDLNGNLGLEYRYNLYNTFYQSIKRFMDIGLSLIISIVISPILIILGMLVALDSPGPIFFIQERLGKEFKIFKIIKFRTMEKDAEQKLNDLLEKDPAAYMEYQKYHKLNTDQRLTRMGKWLRRFSLDELPQLFNVLTGSMSLIGPRAYMPTELNDMSEFASIILQIPPGLTGWWQVMGRHETTFEQRLRLDEYYISNWSLWMDIYIFMKTIWVVLAGKGA